MRVGQLGILLVTHGPLAPEMLAAAERILGRELPAFQALSLDWSEGWEEARARVEASLAAFPPEVDGFLVLTDLYGDTPSRAAAGLGIAGQVEIVTGVNLPMVVRLGCADLAGRDVAEVARWIEEKGRQSIRRATPAEAGPPSSPCADPPDRGERR
jgi:PTS system mannose-specific IIA component